MPDRKQHFIFRRNLLLFFFLCSSLILPSSVHLEFCVSFTGWNLAVTVANCHENEQQNNHKFVGEPGECTDGHHFPLGCGRSRLDLCQTKSKNSLRDWMPLPLFDKPPVFLQSFCQQHLYSKPTYSDRYSLPPPDKLLQLRSTVIRC